MLCSKKQQKNIVQTNNETIGMTFTTHRFVRDGQTS